VSLPRRRRTKYNRRVLRIFPSRAFWLMWLTLLVMLVASCDGSLRLEVVDQGVDSNLAIAGKSASAGTPSVNPSGGTAEGGSMVAEAGSSNEGGSPEVPQGGSAGVIEGGSSGGGGMPDVPVWDAPPRYTASFVPFSFPEQYVRYQDTLGIIAALDTSQAADKEAASFQMIPGLWDSKCVSFRAANKRGAFFRHSGSRIYLHVTDEGPLFAADATFCQEKGFADPQAITFRSANYPQRVIHLRNVSELWIDDVPDPMTPEFAAESTFYRTTALNEGPSP
jgi:hypothetical protein